MTLSFSQQINGKPNYFVHKIWRGIFTLKLLDADFISYCYQPWFKKFGETCPLMDGVDIKPKIHTIRFDAHKRWRVGMAIHPVINNRTPNRFQFAPTIECKSVQRIDIKDVTGTKMTGADLNYGHLIKHRVGDVDFYLAYEVYVDGKRLMSDAIDRLAINDGFESADSFFEYFKDGIVDGSLIHWTDIKY